MFEQKPKKTQPALNVVASPKYKKRDRMTVLRIVSGVAVVVTVTCVMLYSRAELTALSYRVGQQKEAYQLLVSENTRLKAELESKVSLRSIEESAQELGLAKIQPYQVEYIYMDQEDEIELTGVSEASSLTEKLNRYVQSFLEYIRIR